MLNKTTNSYILCLILTFIFCSEVHSYAYRAPFDTSDGKCLFLKYLHIILKNEFFYFIYYSCGLLNFSQAKFKKSHFFYQFTLLVKTCIESILQKNITFILYFCRCKFLVHKEN